MYFTPSVIALFPNCLVCADLYCTYKPYQPIISKKNNFK